MKHTKEVVEFTIKTILEDLKKNCKNLSFFNLDNNKNKKIRSLIRALNEIEFDEIHFENFGIGHSFMIPSIIENEKFHNLANLLHGITNYYGLIFKVQSHDNFSAEILVRTIDKKESKW